MVEIIPAVDILEGRCVRLEKGERGRATVYDLDPVAVARRFARAGATRLHVVGLDGAIAAQSPPLPVLRAIVEQTGLPVQYGGGLRSVEEMLEALGAGASWVITGTSALADPGFLRQAASAMGSLTQVILALDVRDGRLLVKGWQAHAARDVVSVLEDARLAGITTLMVTDAGADGTMGGIRPAVFAPFMDSGFSIIAAGGVSGVDDVRLLAGRWGGRGLAGIVIGSALLKGRMTVEDAQSAARAAVTGRGRQGPGEVSL